MELERGTNVAKYIYSVMRIPEDIVIRLNELSIESVAEKLGIEIKRHKAQCFMHDDHDPSLKFSPSKNLFFCFVCDKGGGPIQLVMEHEGWSFLEACLWLAKEFNIIIPENRGYIKPIKKATHKIYLTQKDEKSCALDEELFRWLIEKAVLSEVARKFLFEERHFKKDVIQALNIKSITDSNKAKDLLVSTFGEDRCVKSGIVRRGEYGTYFYFYTPCLLFPYYEQDGLLMGIQSRYLGDKKDAPRFQFLAAQKTRLFNLPILNSLKRGDKLYISEGITDCLAMLSSALKAVAIPSATIHPLEDLILLKNYDLHMYSDQDEAGQRAFMELRRFFVNNYSTVKAEKLPEGMKDYCEYYISTQAADGKE